MVIVVAAVTGIVLVGFAGADLRRLSDLPIRRLWLVWLAIGLQVGVLSLLAGHVAGRVGDGIHLATYGLAIAFMIVNRRIRGMSVIALGTATNVSAIVANGGVMPASATAWRFAGLETSSGFSNSLPVARPRLVVLGDIFALPAGWPLANVFSIGDVLIVWGMIWMASSWCRRSIAADRSISGGASRPCPGR